MIPDAVRYESMQHRLLANSVVADESYPLVNGAPCWLWTGKIDRYGYGVLNVRWKRGERKGKVRRVKAHREAIKAFNGRHLGAKYLGCHECDVRHCIQPEHLLGGTPKKNVRDCVTRGRHWSGFLGPKNGRGGANDEQFFQLRIFL